MYINLAKTLKFQTSHKCIHYIKPTSLVQSPYVLNVFVAIYERTIKIITKLCIFWYFSPDGFKIWKSSFQDVGFHFFSWIDEKKTVQKKNSQKDRTVAN